MRPGITRENAGMGKQTVIPWRVIDDSGRFVVGADGHWIPMTGQPREFYERIVRAVNAHESLTAQVEAMREALEHLERFCAHAQLSNIEVPLDLALDLRELRDKGKAALALGEEKL